MITTIILAIARAVLSEGAVALLERWLKPKPPADPFTEIRKADQAAAKADKKGTDNDPNRRDPNP